jgi:hypothetical protein
MAMDYALLLFFHSFVANRQYKNKQSVCRSLKAAMCSGRTKYF